MENLDEGMEKRVWERIHGIPQGPSLQAMAASEKALASVYLRLARMTQGPEKPLLRQLYERERRHSHCLHGISQLGDGKALSVRTVPPAPDTTVTALRKCYAASLKAAAEYENRSADREFGHIYRQMAAEEREHCIWIAEILGSMGK